MRSIAQWVLAGLLLVLAAADATFGQGRGPRSPQSVTEQRQLRAAARIAREPNPRSSGAARRDGQEVRDERRRSHTERTAQRPDRMVPTVGRGTPEFGRDVALRQQLAEVDRLRDQALLTGDDALLDRADAMEIDIRDRFEMIEASARGGGEYGRFTTGDVAAPATTEAEALNEERDFERGLGRETSRQVRGLPPIEGEVELGAPGYGRRTATERRYLRGDEPRGPWDAQYWPMPEQSPDVSEPSPEQLPEVTEPTTDPTLP